MFTDGQTEEQDEEVALEDAIVRKLTVAIYCRRVGHVLAQAIEVEAEAEWWVSVETSRLAVVWFFLQCMVFIFVFFISKDVTFFR